jgi:hypothetical protein
MRAAGEVELMDALRDGDKARVAALYAAEGRRLLADGRIDAACFLMTNAYVFALDAGDLDRAADLHETLCRNGRDE